MLRFAISRQIYEATMKDGEFTDISVRDLENIDYFNSLIDAQTRLAIPFYDVEFSPTYMKNRYRIYRHLITWFDEDGILQEIFKETDREIFEMIKDEEWRREI